MLNAATDFWAGTGIAIYSVALAYSGRHRGGAAAVDRAFVYDPPATPSCRPGLGSSPSIYVAYSLAWLAAPVATHNLYLGVTAIL
jgi:hypothetical protein